MTHHSARLSVVSIEGWATLMGWTTRIWFSDEEGWSSEVDKLEVEDFLLAIFLDAIPNDMFEWVALRWYGWYSGWIISSVQVFVAISKLGSCWWELSETTSSEAILEAFSEFGLKLGNSPE